MFGAIAKTYYAKVLGVEPEDIFVCPSCPARPRRPSARCRDEDGSGEPDVDVVLTVREIVPHRPR